MPASSAPSSTLRWRGGALEPVADAPAAVGLLAADSWLVEEGRALGVQEHRARFLAALPAQVLSDAERFWAAAVAALPTHGAWFPRVEFACVADGVDELRLRLRPAPERERTVVLATHRGADPRTAPTVKGPDLEALSSVRRAAEAAGAGEGVILSPEGFVVEGAYSALLWWREDALCLPHDDLARIPSVTAAIVERIAAQRGVELIREHATPAQLDGSELWVLSALHGPRRAVSWIDGPRLEARPGRLEEWRRRLDALRRPVA